MNTIPVPAYQQNWKETYTEMHLPCTCTVFFNKVSTNIVILNACLHSSKILSACYLIYWCHQKSQDSCRASWGTTIKAERRCILLCYQHYHIPYGLGFQSLCDFWDRAQRSLESCCFPERFSRLCSWKMGRCGGSAPRASSWYQQDSGQLSAGSLL